VSGRQQRAAAACGFGAVALELLVPLVGGRLEPGYSHVSQYISELGAEGASHAAWVSLGGFAPTGALVLGFLAFASGSLPGGLTRWAGLLAFAGVGACYLIAAFFPCDAGCPAQGSTSQQIHNASALLLYAGAPAGMLLLCAAFRGAPRWRPLVPASAACAAVAFAGFLALLAPPLDGLRGLSQRVAEGAIFFWIAVVSAFLLRLPPPDRRSG
jgi:hypothetical protein